MTGITFSGLRKYVETRLGPGSWPALLKEAKQDGKMYLATQEYPDAQLVELVVAATRVTGLGAAAILEDFGEFIAPDLLSMFKASIKPAWRTLDVLEHTEETLHKAVRLRNPGARPPELVATRKGPREVVIEYSSPRKLCAVAKGIARGIAKHYNENVEISEAACMHKGAPSCRISVKTL